MRVFVFCIERMKTQRRLVKSFICSAGILFAITAVSKFISSFGSAGILQASDPILTISFRIVFRIVGSVELVTALFCFFGKPVILQTGLIALLTTNFVVYHLGVILLGYHKPCPCLGNLTDALHISPHTAGTVMEIILTYLLITSYVMLFWLWRNKSSIFATA